MPEISLGRIVKAYQSNNLITAMTGDMGDTGYSKTEGTTGRVPVHLHLGIYLTVNGREVSVNSYPALRLTEQWKVNAVYE